MSESIVQERMPVQFTGWKLEIFDDLVGRRKLSSFKAKVVVKAISTDFSAEDAKSAIDWAFSTWKILNKNNFCPTSFEFQEARKRFTFISVQIRDFFKTQDGAVNRLKFYGLTVPPFVSVAQLQKIMRLAKEIFNVIPEPISR